MISPRSRPGDPADPKWGPPGAFHHWGESELGYYLADDEYVIRKHARMLASAGVDTIIIDVTNSFTYDSVYLKLCEVYRQLRTEGLKTPQMCFIANSHPGATVKRLYDSFYAKGLYPELWFKWDGKPLILSSTEELSDDIKSFFTFRRSWAWSQAEWFGNGQDKWTWLDHYPQAPGWHVKGVPEELSVCVAQHPTTTIGRSYHDGKEPAEADRKTAEGLCFAEQWKRALEVNPPFVFVTGWNEWVAQRGISEGDDTFAGKKIKKGDTYFVDAYNQEFSRDIEPMKGGHTDDYYYQLIGYVRKYKGVRAPEPASAPKKISIDGKFEDWKDVRPEFRDYFKDTEHRNSKGWGEAGTYVNNTGRNDFVRLKVARDSRNLYFYAETYDPITSFKDPNWMLLYINSDGNPTNGWNGYDFLVNCGVTTARMTTVKALDGSKWSDVAKAGYRAKGNKIEIAVSLSALKLAGKNDLTVDFHWADNPRVPNDIIEFSTSGDSAPDRRFNYRYTTVPTRG